jgi:hypothetical protein
MDGLFDGVNPMKLVVTVAAISVGVFLTAFFQALRERCKK